jgi:hypothetical protein
MTEPPPEMTATIAHDDFAERTVLAACLNDPAMIGRARRSLSTDSFWRNHHGLIFAAMMDLDDRQQPTSPFAVYETLIAEKNLTRAGGANTLHDLYAFPYFGTNLAVATVGKLARQRSRSAVAMRFSQIAEEVEDPDAAAFAWAKAAVELEVADRRPRRGGAGGGAVDVGGVLRPPAEADDSVVPGLLDRQEVVMILAAPGVGKSWLSRQVALTVAAGTHPFHAGRRIPPMRTLLIDLENPESTVQRQTWRARTTRCSCWAAAHRGPRLVLAAHGGVEHPQAAGRGAARAGHRRDAPGPGVHRVAVQPVLTAARPIGTRRRRRRSPC